jgi:hypothetical protein
VLAGWPSGSRGYTGMVQRLALVLFLACLAFSPLSAQTQKAKPPAAKPPAAKPAPAPKVEPKTEPAEVQCPSPLGVGVTTKRVFCDVPIGRTSADGIVVKIPPHKGSAYLIFDLHNRQTYSEEQVKARKSYARLTATIGILTMDNTLLTRAVVQNEFRVAGDLFDRIAGGAGPSGVKAVAPTGEELVRAEIPEGTTQVCVLGEKLSVKRLDGDELFVAPGRPIALISDINVEYVEPPKKVAPKKPVVQKKAPVKR